MSTRKFLAAVALCWGMIGILGCGGGADGLQTLKGTVTYDGAPIPEGRIQFRETTGDQRAFAGTIENGAYEVRVPTGTLAVEIRASRLIPGKFDESNPDEPEQMGEMYIPEKYNSRTELQVNVDSGTEVENFDLVAS